MLTRKPVSTISYNTELFLQGVLNRLISERKIETWQYIRHYPETDETKEHIHLFVEPAKQLDTIDLGVEFLEPVGANIPPLACMPFRNSKYDEWYLYSSHDIDYLQSKLLYREHHYPLELFKSSHDEYFAEKVRVISCRAIKASKRYFEAIDNGFTFEECIRQGLVPLNAVLSYREAYARLYSRIRQEKRKKHLSDLDEYIFSEE